MDPMKLFDEVGADATRWTFYSSNPWNAKRFSTEQVREAVRDVILPIWNSYSFFVTYARVDGWKPKADPPLPPLDKGGIHPLDRWLLGELTHLNREVTLALEAYDVARASSAINRFVDQLTNWYIRRSRRRFWKSGDDRDKTAAYETLYRALTDFSLILAPFLPFLSEELYQNLVRSVKSDAPESVHLCSWPQPPLAEVDEELSRRMDLTRRVVRAGRDLRQKSNIKVRQPLAQISVVVPGGKADTLEGMADLISDELNVRRVVILPDDSRLVTLRAEPNFKSLGPKFGKEANKAAQAIKSLPPDQVLKLEQGQDVNVDGMTIIVADVTIQRKPLENWAVSSDEGLTVALNLNLTPDLIGEGIARELVHQIQNRRKDQGLDVADRIHLGYHTGSVEIRQAVAKHAEWIKNETLTVDLQEQPDPKFSEEEPLKVDHFFVYYKIEKVDVR
jgi:isoleucyl-tRNA synthetase